MMRNTCMMWGEKNRIGLHVYFIISMKEELLVKYNNVRQKSLCEKILNRKVHYSDLLDRTIVSNNPDPMIGSNKISTSKYNLISFPLFNLLEQFTKPSNLYFLLIGILQMIPAISVSEGKPTMFFPLFIVVAVSMAKDFAEDWKRHKSDKRENKSRVEILNDLGYSQRKWEDILVGDIIRIHKDEYVPCDVLLLKHSEENTVAYVETKNLDGQTNLKLRKVPHCLQSLQREPETDVGNLEIEVSYEKPNPFLNSFNGNMKLDNVDIEIRQKKYPLEATNIILRGCSLKINSYAMGMCLYNGHETKIMLNGGQSKQKRSDLEKILNTYFKYICVFQVVATLISAIIYGLIVSLNYENLAYINESPYFLEDTIFTWGSWFISFSNFIPISLLVTVQMVRYGQGYLLSKDQHCSSKGFPIQVQTSNVNEQLGQIHYLLSDKTGTLTQNLMEFKCISINGHRYGESKNQEVRASILTEQEGSMTSANPLSASQKLKTHYVDFPEQEKQRLLYDLTYNQQIGEDQKKLIDKVLIHLSLCHNVIKQEEEYSSSSPDELALVNFASHMGYSFLQKTDHNILRLLVCVNEQREFLHYQLLHVLEFTSERKRMSVIVRDEKTGRVFLLCKGADDVILQRSIVEDQEHRSINEDLYHYAFQGLRTLLLAEKELDPHLYRQWEERYAEAILVVGSDRMERIYELQSEIEKGLRVLGVTAIQDKLQDGVKESIKGMKEAGIKVWMLTGDKKQTAVSIGYSCGLIDETCEKITLDCEPEHANGLITNVESMMDLLKGEKVTIVSGEILKRINEETMEKLSRLLQESESVICCRVSPKDKETLTTMVKAWGRVLAVGDGANDVNMINAANVGVGVRGIEGSQATRASDYVISEFKMLKRLIVYHGLNYYYKNSQVTIYTLYKNILVTLPILAYGPLSMESGTYIYQTWVFQFFNILYCSLPIMIFGLFNTKYSSYLLAQSPTLYSCGQQNRHFNPSILLRLVLTTILLGIGMVYVVFFTDELTIHPQGYLSYEVWSGMLIFNIVVLTINIRILLLSNQISFLLLLTLLAGILSYYLMFLLVEVLLYSDCKGLLLNQLQSSQFWQLLLFFSVYLEGVEWAINTYIQLSKPTYSESREAKLYEVQLSKDEQNKKVKDISGNDVAGGYAFAEDQLRSLHFI